MFAMGIDISGALMGATLSASFNTDHMEREMRVLSLGYSVNDDLSVNVGQTAYSTDNDGTFFMPGTNMSGGWANGNLGYLASGNEDLHYGISYNLGGISLGVICITLLMLQKEWMTTKETLWFLT